MSKSVRRKNRKRPAVKPGGSPFSRSLREASALIQSGKQADGLGLLNQLAAESKNPTRRGKISLQIATSQAALSRHGEAAAAFAKAAQFGRQAGDTNLALKGGIGEVRSLLRSLRTEEAKAAATLILADLDKTQKDFDALSALTPAQLASAGGITIPARPPRPSVGLTQLANAFIESGLTDEARVFLQKAVLLSPNGASRARQALAKLSLAADQPAEAERYARESLQMGRFQAKTVAAWQYYLDARARQQISPILEPALFETLLAHASGRILSSSGLCIVTMLRAHGDPAWKSIAAQLLANPAKGDPVTLTEIAKILHADSKLTLSDPPLILAARALSFFKARDATASEQIAHGKVYVRFTFEAGKEPDLDALVTVASKRYGDEHAVAVRHAAALAAKSARKFEIARGWLLALTTELSPDNEPWGRATWALAAMESTIEGRKGEASALYLTLAANEQMPSRFRVQAMVRGFEFLTSDVAAINENRIKQNIRRLIDGMPEYRSALDAARQLALIGSRFSDLRDYADAKGKALVKVAIKESLNMRSTLEIVEYFSRKQYWDLNNAASVIAIWENFTPAQRSEFKTIGGSRWYEYLSIVFQCMTKLGRASEAIALVSDVVDGSTSTKEGYVIVGSTYALWLISQAKVNEAFRFFQWISVEAPTHRSAAPAHYWLGLKNLTEGSRETAIQFFWNIRACYAGRPSFYSEWMLDCAALLLLDLEQEMKLMERLYTTDFRQKTAVKIESDKEILNS